MLDDQKSVTTSATGLKSTFEVYKAEGDTLFKQNEYKKALTSYDKALEMRPDDKHCLVARSRCHLQLGDAQAALKDAEVALEQDKEFNRGLFQKAEALYLIGDFETALVFYHRGHRLRPEQQEFRLGIQKCQEAINNSIGTPESVKLENKGDLSYFYQKEEQSKYKKDQAKRRPRPASKTKETKPATAQDTKTVKQLLGELYADRQFLENLLKDEAIKEAENAKCKRCHRKNDWCICVKTAQPGRKRSEAISSKQIKQRLMQQKLDEAFSRDTKSSVTIKQLAQEGLQYLDTRTDFWRQQKPMYARKRDKMLQEGKQAGSGSGKVGDPAKFILKNLDEIDKAQNEGRHEDSLKQTKKCLKTLDHMSDQDIANKADVLCNLHSCAGNAYLELGNYEMALEHHKKDRDIAEESDIFDAKSRSMDNLGRVYARMGRFDEAIAVWEEKLPLSKTALESTWLYHEIGRCYLEISKYDQSKSYGEKSLASAKEAGDGIWELNASVLIAQSEVKLGDYQAALGAFEQSLDMARIQNDEAAEAAITKAMDDVNNRIINGIKEGDNGSPHPSDDNKKDYDRVSDTEQEDKKSVKSEKYDDHDRSSVKSDHAEQEKYRSDKEDDYKQGESTSDSKVDKPEKESSMASLKSKGSGELGKEADEDNEAKQEENATEEKGADDKDNEEKYDEDKEKAEDKDVEDKYADDEFVEEKGTEEKTDEQVKEEY